MSIEIGGTVEIAKHEKTNKEFLKDLFGLDSNLVVITDISTLSDFSTCVMRNAELSNFSDYYEKAESKLLKLIHAKYRLTLDNGVKTKLVDIYKMIEGKQK